MAWTLTTIIAKWRELTGRSSTDDISLADVTAIINDYYQEDFPFEIDSHTFRADYTATATVDDAGEIALADTDLELNEPITANNDIELRLYHDTGEFFRDYPVNQDETFFTPPTLSIGTTSAAAVKNAAFKYKVGDWVYSKASAETALSGSTVPQNKYGAWLLSINSAGTITITAATDNATGYGTAALAVNGLVIPTSSCAVMGFVTAINTVSGGFIPGTTLLSVATVTDTYTDGNPDLRTTPTACCIANGKLYIRPKVSDTFYIRAVASLSTPTALTGSTEPVDENWGPAVATGSAVKWLSEKGETERVTEIMGAANIPGTHEYNVSRINKKKLRQQSDRESVRSF